MSGAASLPLLRVCGLRKSFQGHLVLRDVSFELQRGAFVVLKGSNGSGKTTLLNLLSGHLRPDAGCIEVQAKAGNVAFHFPRGWFKSLRAGARFSPERLACLGIGRTWQDVRLFKTQTLLDNVVSASSKQLGERPIRALLGGRGVSAQESSFRAQARTWLERLGISDFEADLAGRISLGQSKRVAIVRAVQAGATVLFMDEPLAGLDAAGADEVIHLLLRLKQEQGVSLVLVEHALHLPKIVPLATSIWTLSGGRLSVESGSSRGLDQSDDQFRARDEWAAKGVVRISQKTLPGGAELSKMCPAGVEPGEVVLELRDVVVRRGARWVLGRKSEDDVDQGLSFCLRQGELTVLEAPNGWGKTSLFEALMGLIPWQAGAAMLRGVDLGAVPPWKRSALGLTAVQARDNAFPDLTVRASLDLARVDGVPPGLQAVLSRRVSDLSGGERQKVALACALSPKRSPCLMLDEPFVGLDGRSANALRTELIERCRASAAVLILVPASSSSTI